MDMTHKLIEPFPLSTIGPNSFAVRREETNAEIKTRNAGDVETRLKKPMDRRSATHSESVTTVREEADASRQKASFLYSEQPPVTNSLPAPHKETIRHSQADVVTGVHEDHGTILASTAEAADMTSAVTEAMTSCPEVTSEQDDTVFTVERVADGESRCITLGKMDGVYTAPWPSLPQQSAKAREFLIANSDVVLIGYPKSGTHWMWEILHMLLRGRSEPTTLTKERLMFTFSSQEFFDQLEPPRVFNTHSTFLNLPRCLQNGAVTSKTIFLLRNPKDVAVSYYHFLLRSEDFQYQGTWNGFFRLFMEGKVPCGSWFDYVLDWEKCIADHPDFPVLYVYYEDLKQDCGKEIKRIADYLGLDCERGLTDAIAAACSFSRMKRHALGLDEQEGNGKIGEIIYRKGIVGDWKNWFSEEQNREFAELYNSKMASSVHRLKFDIEGV